MLSVNLRVGRGKFEMLDDQIQGTCTARKCKKNPKKQKQTNKRTKNEKKKQKKQQQQIQILCRY